MQEKSYKTVKQRPTPINKVDGVNSPYKSRMGELLGGESERRGRWYWLASVSLKHDIYKNYINNLLILF